MLRMRERLAAPRIVASVVVIVLAAGCGGGGGGGPKNAGNVTDPIIVLSGPSGRLSRTVGEANLDNGANPPPTLAPTVTTSNHWIRLEFPYPIVPSSILENSPLTAPFSYLNGNITVSDVAGDHVPGLALVNGFDVFGFNHATDPDFPHDVQGTVDRNLGPNVFLYVADVDRNLSTIAAFGYQIDPTNPNLRVEITDVANHANGTLDVVRVTVGIVSGLEYNAIWTFNIGNASDSRLPFIVRIDSELKDPTQPFNNASAATQSSFVVEFSEPVVPKSVGKSAALNGTPYNANMPLPPQQMLVALPNPPSPVQVPNYPFPNITITATVNTSVGRLFVPFDCNPVNSNNLATYRLRPLVDLPGSISVDLVVRGFAANSNFITLLGDSTIDLAGNRFDGPDADNDGIADVQQLDANGDAIPDITQDLNLNAYPDAVEDADKDGIPDHGVIRSTFAVGPGAAFANVPVSPEVIYWLPAAGDGIGAIDLNGRGLSTNTPGANATRREGAIQITKIWINAAGCEKNPGGLNLVSGIGLWGHPGNLPTPTDLCTLAPMLEFGHNKYLYPVGTGSFIYGPGANASRGEPWEAPLDPGNPGTPFPGVNEGSSGFETICRDSAGDVILTGRQFGRVGVINDLIVGEFLDLAYFDSQNGKTNNLLHFSFFNGGQTARGNTIADPPTPNPPPLRYWVGLPTIGVVIDQADPTGPPLLLEGEEVFSGFRYTAQGFQQVQANENAPNSPDQTVFPHFGAGVGGQSATQVFTYSSRQQVGNFLYAADASNHVVQAINSNTMRVISSIPTSDPTGLAMSPDLSRLYVTNFASDTVSVIGCDPFRDHFHEEIARIKVGAGPRAIAVQPEHEDVFVCNYGENSISIVNSVSLVVRKTIDALISGPYDVETTPRQIQPNAPSPPPGPQYTFGFGNGVYFAYISNFLGNTVAVYESGPDGPQGIGIDNIRGALPTTDQEFVIIQPKGLCASPLPNPSGVLAGGCFVAHRDDLGFGRVSQCQLTQQLIFGPINIVAPPGFFIPPGFRDRAFEITATWGNTDANRLIGSRPVDVALSDMNVAAYQGRPSGAPNLGAASVPPQVDRTGRINSKNPIRVNSPNSFSALTPDRLYVSFEDTDSIQVLAAGAGGVILNTIPGPGFDGVRKLVSYWRQ